MTEEALGHPAPPQTQPLSWVPAVDALKLEELQPLVVPAGTGPGPRRRCGADNVAMWLAGSIGLEGAGPPSPGTPTDTCPRGRGSCRGDAHSRHTHA
ncbi:UNVERIFIED_CONTAM: hypothetical protein K2H54_037943 [Gekko kuhli]